MGEQIAALEPGIDISSVARQHLVEGGKRGLEPPQPGEHNGAIVERIEIARVDRDDPVADGQRLLEPIESQQRRHPHGQCPGRPGLELDRLAEQVVSLLGTALLIPDETEQMQRVELIRVAREHGAIGRLRLGDSARLVQQLCLLSARMSVRKNWVRSVEHRKSAGIDPACGDKPGHVRILHSVEAAVIWQLIGNARGFRYNAAAPQRSHG